ncbi:MAG TPA: ATP-binding cassette domain-containing protein, partial [Yinghuangia sp.]|nr:ATP-binding cassette domain-containing protein [Yinghuangia sp.]
RATAEDRELVAWAMERMDVQHLRDRPMRDLSGGQRQRIAIARVMLKDPAIVVLDEATSALDATSERAVQNALNRLLSDRTSLVIAHRLATIRNADRIAVVEHGRIADMGTHTALLKSSATYRSYCREQSVA